MTYEGRHAVLDVPALSRAVERGVPVDIEDAALCEQLRSQGWKEVEVNNNPNGGND